VGAKDVNLPGYDAWKTTPPDEYASDDVNGHAVIWVTRRCVGEDGALVETDVAVEVRVARGEVVEATAQETGEAVELTPDEEEEAIERVAMNPIEEMDYDR
jgi:hypothetical protein